MIAWARTPVIFALKVYKRVLSPILPVACRFEPTCSEYAMQAVERHGVLRGGWLSVKRLARCRPGGPAGHDPIP